ncbi:MAG: FecR family protein [Thermodesulfobacteriota bacterium]
MIPKRRIQEEKGLVVLLLLSLAVALAWPAGARAEPGPTTTVVSVAGRAEVISEDETRATLTVGRILSIGQAIETGPDGRVVLELEDGSRLELFEDSRIELAEVLTEEEKEISFSMVMGYLHLKLKKLFAPNLVVTPTVVAGVRGTEFMVSVADDGASVVSVSEGRVSVSTDLEGEEKEEAELAADREVHVEEAGGPLTPRARTLRTAEDAQGFRRERLEKLIPRLPQVAVLVERHAEKTMDKLIKVAGLMKTKAENISQLAAALKNLGGPGSKRDPKAKLRLLQQLKREADQLRRLGKAYRVLHPRLKTIFVRTKRLVEILPRFKDRLGPDYTKVEQAFTAILARGPEIKKRLTALDAEVRQAVRPVLPILKKIQAPAGKP